MLPLFDAHPHLSSALPHVSLGLWPTPVAPLQIGQLDPLAASVHLKDDGFSGEPYGGNKVRKLEFLLGRALAEEAKTVLTFGAAGSNHALATAIYARRLGLNTISMLVPQVCAPSIGRNLLYAQLHGAELHQYLGRGRVAAGTMRHFMRLRQQEGKFPQVIPPGGSSPIGACGFVNAAFELRDQVERGELPPPDVIYVASGTMGTCVGLVLGLRAAGLDAVVQSVRVTDPPYTSLDKALKLYDATQRLLHACDPSFPLSPFPERYFVLRDEFLGEKYGVYTQEGLEAIERAREAGLKLEGTYTAKALAALLHDARQGQLRGRHVLFWNTYNARDFSREIEGLDYHALPADFHPYFEPDPQPLAQPNK